MTGTMSPSSPSETAIPRWTDSCTVCFSPSSHAFRSGNSRRASIVARATNGSAVSFCGPRLRAASTAPMSHSAHVVHVAAVSSERFMCSPMSRRIFDSGWAAAAAPALAGAAAGASGRYGDSMCNGGSSPFSTNASTSFFVTLPPRPLPSTFARSMPCSAAMRVTTGE
jgi:hypothetical protein